ncbi:MAG: BPTI/Kunitz-type proteinase inhibitor domain-containing protein [Candidatus Micrarchaeota archaeon]
MNLKIAALIFVIAGIFLFGCVQPELPASAFFLKYEVASGWTHSSTILTLENQKAVKTTEKNGTVLATKTIEFSSEEWNQLILYFINTGISGIKQENLNDCQNVGRDCPTDGPSHKLTIQFHPTNNQPNVQYSQGLLVAPTNLEWYYLLETPEPLSQTLNKINEILNRFDEPVACTMEAKLCPDGTSVGRTLPNCEFAACPSNCNWKPGSCEMLIARGRFFYNTQTGACEEFEGGSGCNPPPFLTLQECQTACVSTNQ